MRNIFKIFWSDAKRLSQNVVAVVIIMGLSILPSLYAWFNIFSNWDPYGPDSTSNMSVAVVSEDKGVTIAGVSLNVGDSVIEALKENNTIGWVFVDTQKEAVAGVYSGDYYAALVIPENFTEGMISFLGGEIEHPDIIYYENEKKNAIAPKITGKAKTTVQEQVNATFISTLAESVMKVGGVIAGEDSETGFTDTILEKLTDLSHDLTSYVNVLNSFVTIMDSAQSLLATSQAMLPGLDSMVSNGQSTVQSMESLIVSGSATADTVSQMVSYSFDLVEDSLDNVSAAMKTTLQIVQDSGISDRSYIDSAMTAVPYMKKIFENAVSSWEKDADEATAKKIDAIYDQFDTISSDLSALSENANASKETIETLSNNITTQIETCKTALKQLEDSFVYEVRPNLDATMNSMQNSMIATASILNGIDADFGDVQKVLEDYQVTLQEGSSSLMESLSMAQNLLGGLSDVMTDIIELSQSEQYQKIVEILQSDPDYLGNFISSPVSLETVEVYAIENYGSAMSPFYSILALWVGALILVAIVHVKVHPVPGIDEIKPYQAYFGRYIIFFLVGQTQTLITVLGNLYYIRIQCHNPFLFWLASAVASLVFTLFIYSLTVAMGNVGEALAVVVMVIQVAGAGGTFPIETLPQIYQNIYKFLPFQYGMNAMRETIGGIYGADYWRYLGKLALYIPVSLLIGLIVAIPFRRLNKKIEESKEKSGLMM